MIFDRVIIGAGIYGLYAAQYCAKLGLSVLVLECEDAAFTRASYVNQARLHMGYHYPRSFSTAIKTAQYFNRFVDEYKKCINNEFDQIYATSSNFSWTNKEQFIKFCKNTGIKCENIDPELFFQPGLCDGAYFTREYAFDADILKKQMLNELTEYNQNDKVQIKYNIEIESITKHDNYFELKVSNKTVNVLETDKITIASECTTAPDNTIFASENPILTADSGSADPVSCSCELIAAKFVLNTTYASVNQIQSIAGFDTFQIKYELCELILCKVSDNLKNTGITVMDGPFFSLMPFGKTKYHSLSSVTFTPHMTCNSSLPTFECQYKSDGYCTPEKLGNCSKCPVKPKSAWPYMSALVKKYMKPEYELEYVESLFSIKPILKSSEIDDSRPTMIRILTENPTFVSVLSGKINTLYDIDEVLSIGC